MLGHVCLLGKHGQVISIIVPWLVTIVTIITTVTVVLIKGIRVINESLARRLCCRSPGCGHCCGSHCGRRRGSGQARYLGPGLGPVEQVAVLLPRWRELGTGFQMMASGDLCRKLRHRD